MKYSGDHYADLRQKIEEEYRRDVETLEMAKDNQFKELLKDYPEPADLAVKYVEVITKKSRLGSHKRELIDRFFSRIVKGSALDIINDREKCESKSNTSPVKDKDLAS